MSRVLRESGESNEEDVDRTGESRIEKLVPE